MDLPAGLSRNAHFHCRQRWRTLHHSWLRNGGAPERPCVSLAAPAFSTIRTGEVIIGFIVPGMVCALVFKKRCCNQRVNQPQCLLPGCCPGGQCLVRRNTMQINGLNLHRISGNRSSLAVMPSPKTVAAAYGGKAISAPGGSAAPEASGPAGSGKEALVSLGTITRDIPTVSQLLYKTRFKQDCWNIVLNKVNAEKPYKSITPGTEIFLNPRTKEIQWGEHAGFSPAGDSESPAASGMAQNDPSSPAASTPVASGASPELPSSPSTGEVPQTESPEGFPDFAEAVREFIGKDYDQMDCYELVIGGLKNLGVQYKGKGGLGQELIRRAREKGFADNHYLTGEGIVAASGSDVYKKRINTISNPDKQAEALLSDISGVLEQGQILSFSTQTRGHTGVISRKNGVWTFINSGTMDHDLSGGNGGKRVGEELLAEEVKNWFRLARKRNEGLVISLGNIDMTKLASFSPPGGMVSEQA